MKRWFVRILGTAAALALSACAATTDVGLTTTEAVVNGCQKVGDVAVGESIAPREVNAKLSDEARREGANYVLLAQDGARQGAAYKCEGPKVAAKK